MRQLPQYLIAALLNCYTFPMAHIEWHAPGSFCWFELATTDQKAAKAFYQSLFGWGVNDTPMGPDETYTIFTVDGRDCAAGYTMRQEQRGMGIPPNWLVYIAVTNVDLASSKVATAGGTLLMAPFEVMDAGRMSVVQDPTGATFALWQAKKSQGTRIANVDFTIGWADLNTPDPARAAKFYGDVFGWKFVANKDMAPAGPSDYAHIVNGTEMIGGVPPASQRDPHSPPNWMIYVEVPDCAASVAKAKSLGAQVYVDTMAIGENGSIAVLADPQGAVFGLHTGKS
jgi:predicted enzyme related to lactoylglutathione lyase